MINVLIVEDSMITAKSLEVLLEKSHLYHTAAVIENAANAEIICMRGDIQLVLMDICTADGESGIAAAAKIKTMYPDIKVILMTSMPECSFIERARKAGCDSFLYKNIKDFEFLSAISRTMKGEHIYPEMTPKVRIGKIESTDLTKRELEVLRRLAYGETYEEIAAKMDISVNTVKYHVKNLLSKTGFRNTIQMVVDAVEKRLILPKY